MDQKYPVIIFGDFISAYGVIRSLSRHKIPLYMVSPLGKGFALKSRFIKKSVTLNPDDEDFILKLDKWISEAVGPGAVLIVAGEDRYLDVLSKQYKELSGDMKVTFPDWETVKCVRQKRQTYSIARETGVPVPNTYYITSQKELEELLDNKDVVLKYPVFMKAEHSGELLRQYKTKGIICSNDEEVRKSYSEYGGFGGELLLQELIASDNERIMTVLMALNRNSKPIGYLINEKKRSSGKFLSGTFVVSAWSDELLDYSLKLTERIGYYGYAGLQFKFDDQDGKFKFLEINGRISMSNSLALRCGVNLSLLMYKEAIEGPLQEIKEFKQEYPDNVLWWYLVYDLIAYFRWNRKFVTFSDYIKSLIGCGYIIEPMNWRDPVPGLISLARPFVEVFKQLLNRDDM